MKNMLESIEYRFKLHWGIRIALYLALFIIISLPIIILQQLISLFVSDNEMVYMFGNSIIIIVATILVIKIIEKSSVLDRLGLKKGGIFKSYTFGFLIGFALIMLSALPIILLFSSSIKLSSPVPYEVIFIYFLFFIIQGAGEEILVRGLIFPIIVKESRPVVALVITSGFFAALHLLNPGVTVLSVLNLALAGLLFGYCVLYFDSLWQACALHTAWNFIQGNILGFEVSGINVNSLISINTKGSDFFTGGSFGIEGSIFSVVVLLVAVLIFHLLCVKKGVSIFRK